MIEFINRLTGGTMWVAEERAEEYKAAGHKPAAETAPEKSKKEPAKRTVKKK